MYVYFAACQRDFVDAIKIGSAADPWKRVDELQMGCPYPIKLLGTMDGGAKDERRLHGFFEDSRMTPGWFRPDDDLIEYIFKNCKNAKEIGRIVVEKKGPTTDFEKRIVNWVAPNGKVNENHPLYQLYKKMGFGRLVVNIVQ